MNCNLSGNQAEMEPNSNENAIDEAQKNQEMANPWYAVRIFSSKQKEIADYFEAKGITCFIPMEYTWIVDKENHKRQILKPVVRNLAFIEKVISEKAIRKIVNEIPHKISIIRKDREHLDYYEIPAKQMKEFQLMCNPELEIRKYISGDDAKLKIGSPVTVKYGPLKGLSGKLVRQSKKYYLLKEVPGMGVMIKVSRWCCQSM